VLRSIRAHRLRAADPVPTVPCWATPALRQPPAQPWPENDDLWQLTITDIEGREGRYGTFSSIELQIIRLQIAPAISRPFAFRPWLPVAIPVVGRHRSGSHYRIAVSAVDLALWDLVGGLVAAAEGCSAYASALGFDIHHELATSVASWLVGEGYQKQKWRLPGELSGMAADLDRIADIAAAAGGIDRILIDGVARWPWEYATAIVPELAALGVGWIEEPVAGGIDELAAFAGPDVPLAWGEHAYDPETQQAALRSGYLRVWQPDVGWCGGLSAALASTRAARQRGIPVYPHGGSLIAGCALAARSDRATVPAVEYHLTQEPRRQRCTDSPLAPVSGRFRQADLSSARELRIDADSEFDLLDAA
jgi:L-alanine-DL-glutamate epimerase-like enolase superfamily enzyme